MQKPLPLAEPSVVVLDTNVVLDLWLFEDHRSTALRAALADGTAQALVTAPMLAELADVLQRPFAQGRLLATTDVPAALQSASCLVSAPTVAEASAVPRCADPDDQKFIDLAWCRPAAWLLSRDRALLALARPALRHGLRIVTPEHWRA